MMRKRKDIEKDGLRPEFLILEVLLDMRDLTVKQQKKLPCVSNKAKGRGKAKA